MFDKNNQFKTLITNEEVIHDTVNTVCDAVASSMGPAGLLTLVRHASGNISSTKDGVTIARNLSELSSYEESMVAKILVQSAEKTAYVAGDSTTSTLVLTKALYNYIYHLDHFVNLNQIKLGVDFAVEEISKKVDNLATPIDKYEDILNVAMVSSNGDKQISKLVADAYFKLGKDALINTKESDLQTSCSLEFLEGFTVDRGYESSKFMTNEVEGLCELENPLILLTEEKIESIFDVDHILKAARAKDRAIIILARDYSPRAVNDMVNYKQQGVKLCAIKSPNFGDVRKRTLEDIAVVTGATVVSMENGFTFSDVKLSHLGSCEKVECYKNNTIFIRGAGTQEKIQERVVLLEKQMVGKDVEDLYTRHQFVERLSRLKGTVANIVVGANTEVERGEVKDRLDDAILATKVAMQSGIVAGGGSVLAKLSTQAKKTKVSTWTDDFFLGYKIVYEILTAPVKQLLLNAGYSESEIEVIADKVAMTKQNQGFNIVTGQLCNLKSAGVIEPALVLKESLKNAASVALSLALTRNLIF